ARGIGPDDLDTASPAGTLVQAGRHRGLGRQDAQHPHIRYSFARRGGHLVHDVQHRNGHRRRNALVEKVRGVARDDEEVRAGLLAHLLRLPYRGRAILAIPTLTCRPSSSKVCRTRAGSARISTASVSRSIYARCASRIGSRPPSWKTAIRSSTASPASLRRFWIWWTSSRAWPSSTRSGVRVVSSTANSPACPSAAYPCASCIR